MAWDFLIYMLQRLGFHDIWVKQIKVCFESSWSFVSLNGSPSQEFKSLKGLCLGYPLAPFLFLVVAEGLSGLIRGVVEK